MDAVAAELLRTAASVDADVQLRSLALQQQCEELERVCRFIRDLEFCAVEQKAARQAETSALEQSIQDAIERARKVRAELAAGDGDGSDDEQDQLQSSVAEDRELGSILALAKATRTAQQTQETTEAEVKTEVKKEQEPKVRLEYPRKLKAMETQLEEVRLKEREASTRFAFCCKMSEHLSLSPSRRQLIAQQQEKFGSDGRMDVPVTRIQTSFPKQVARLRGGYQRLTAFLLEKIEVESPAFRQVAEAPTFSKVFPVYHRLKQAKKLLRLLNNETRALLERLPASQPKLSAAAAAHRDAMLSKIRRKTPQAEVGVIDNGALRAATLQAPSPHLHADTELLEKLQAAWVARAAGTADDARQHSSIDTYSTTVREIVLTELSNVVLWSFKTHFTDTGEQPDALQVEAVMRLVRLVDSVALSQGRRYRSVVAPP